MNIFKKLFGGIKNDPSSSADNIQNSKKSLNSTNRIAELSESIIKEENKSEISTTDANNPKYNVEQIIEQKEKEGYTSLGKNIYPHLINTGLNRNEKTLQTIDPQYIYDFFNELKVIISISTPEGTSFLTKQVTDQLQISKEEIYNTALRNLMSINNGELKIANCNFPSPMLKSIKRVMIGSEFDSSLLLIPEIWKQYSANIKDDTLVVSFPSSDLLLVTGYKDFNSAMGMKGLTIKIYNEDNSKNTLLYDQPLIWKNDKWLEFPKGGNEMLEMMGPIFQ